MNISHIKDKRILVTGGTGFVGRHLLPLLTEAGARVSLLCRPSSDTHNLPDGIRIVHADLTTGSGVAEAMRGQDIVIHMAALLFGLGWQDYLRANAGAARILAGAAAKEGDALTRMVFISSLSAAGPCAAMTGLESKDEGLPVSAYGWSKLISERTLKSALGDRLVILRPPIIYGSGDRGLLPVYKGLMHGLAVVPGIRRTFPVSAIHVQDVVQAILLACLPEAHGTYHLSDGCVYPMAKFYEAAARAIGKKARCIGLPLWFMGMTAALSTFGGMITRRLGARRAPNWNMDKYREARQCGWIGSNLRISDELGFRPTVDIERGMEETIQGNQRLGLL